MRLAAVLALLVTLESRAERCDVPPAPAPPAPRDEFTRNRLLVDSAIFQPKAERDRYTALLALHPNSLDSQYLQARSLVGTNSREALRLYARILEKDPDYPWVHLSQLEIFKAETFRDRQKLQASFETFTRVCPSSLAPYFYLDQIPDHDLAVRSAAKVRAMLRNVKTERDLALYRVLWPVELETLPNEEETRQIAEDVKRLLPFASSPPMHGLLQTGAFLDGDRALQVRLATESRAPMKELTAWQKAHPRGNDKSRAYGEARLAESAKLVEMAPENAVGYAERMNALVALEAPAEEILRAAEKFLEVSRLEERPTNQEVAVAVAFVERGIYLDRVPPLVEKIVGRFDNDLRSIHELPQMRTAALYQSINALALQVQAYQKLGQGGKAHETIRQMQELVALHRPSAEVTDAQALNFYSLASGAMWISTAQLAEQEGRKLDALSAYREVSGRLRAATFLPQYKLWTELGGSKEAWAQWVAAIPKDSPKPAVASDTWTRRLPAMSVKDFSGRVWTLDSLKGKTTIAVVWATWCGPCVSELPFFAKLVERVKGRDDVLAISFNVDQNIWLAESFLKEHGYTFPALAAKQYAEDQMGDLGIPRTWIIKDGLIVYEREGFGGDGDLWVEEMLGRLK